jgi:hypothetical protein
VGRTPRLATPGSGPVGQAVHLHHEDAHRGRPRVGEAQVQRAVAQVAAQLAAVQHMAADGVGPAQQGRGTRGMSPAASASRTAELDTRRPCTS